jgi:hypothetical protein
MSEERHRRSVTRRDLITKVGVGAAVAWGVPALTTGSAGASAEASTSKICVKNSRKPGGVTCANACIGAPTCSGTDPCGCLVTTKGCCFCADLTNSSCAAVCKVDTDCPSGSKCVDAACCNNGSPGICLPACPTPGTSARAGTVRLRP